MAQCSIHRGVISAAHEVMNEGGEKGRKCLSEKAGAISGRILLRSAQLGEPRKCTSAMKAGIVLLALVAMGCAVQSEGKAHLLVQKETMPNSGYAGKDLPIRYRIFNVGDS